MKKKLVLAMAATMALTSCAVPVLADDAAADIVIETDGKDKLEICEELVQRIRALDAEE